MSNAVWFSAIFMSSGIREPLRVFNLENEKAIAAQKLHESGQTIVSSELPLAWAGTYYDKLFKSLPDVFYADGFICVSAKCKSVLERFDLGTGGLVPVKMYQHDRITEIPGEFYFLNLGARKDAIIVDQSPGLKQPYPGVDLYRIQLSLLDSMQDDQLSLSANVEDGPDIWADPRVDQSVIMNDRLVSALDKAGLTKSFRLIKCRVAEGGN